MTTSDDRRELPNAVRRARRFGGNLVTKARRKLASWRRRLRRRLNSGSLTPASGSTDVRAAAIVAARNEEVHIEHQIRDLVAEGLDVVLIDNGSEDATVERAERFVGRGLLRIETLPHHGEYSLRRILDATTRVVDSLDHDWVVRVDADEWPQSPVDAEVLRDRIATADREGYNVLNFNEFVFFADDDEDLRGTDYRKRMLRYYFHEPRHPYLMRAWKRNAGVGIGGGDGHVLEGDVRLYPHDMILRHYVSLGHAHLCEKYLPRNHPEDEVARGWHRGRRGLTADALRVRPSRAFRYLDRWDSRHFDRSRPVTAHFWDRGPGLRILGRIGAPS